MFPGFNQYYTDPAAGSIRRSCSYNLYYTDAAAGSVWYRLNPGNMSKIVKIMHGAT